MSGTLYAFPNNFRANKILITAQYSGHKVTLNPDFVLGETDKSAEFLKKFPFGKVPAYESGDVKLFRTNAICYYVGNEQTRGGDRKAEVIQWIDFADNVILPNACTWVFPTQGILQYNKQNTEKAKTDLKMALSHLNDFLSTRTYFVGERITQADISVACTLAMLYEHVFEPSFREPFSNVNRWFVTLINQPQFKAVLGEVELCKKMAEFDAKKYNEIHGKADKKEKAGKRKKDGGVGDSKSPNSKKQQEPAGNAVLKVGKNPLANLPKGSFDLDAFKKQFENHKPNVYLKYLWDHFDKENYSIWKGKYKYFGKMKVMFLLRNYIDGMHMRLEEIRKHVFACTCVLKKGGEYSIESVWMWKGQGLAFELCEDWQMDSCDFEWHKLDPDNATDRQTVSYFWTWEGDLGGWKVVDGFFHH